ncbi:MAG: VOC family protein [Bacteroidia bacterium]|nr:VOC family protein [Bacteroidia bacterium]
MKITFKVLLISLFIACFTDSKATNYKLAEIDTLPLDDASLKQDNDVINQKIITFLTFQKEDAEQAMNFYISLFDNSEIVSLTRWGKEAPSKEGTIMYATFKLDGNMFMCSDSPPIHNWDFTPAVSNFVECDNEIELDQLFSKLSENGEVAMPLNNYGFSQKFGWVVDQFGVSWQLNLK